MVWGRLEFLLLHCCEDATTLVLVLVISDPQYICLIIVFRRSRKGNPTGS
jgi:hypothetical protein